MNRGVTAQPSALSGPGEQVRRWWSSYAEADTRRPAVCGELLRAAVDVGLLDVAAPASGQTAGRWEALAAWGECDLTLARLVEAHVDALAILDDLGAARPDAGQTWGVWAAEPPNARVVARETVDGWVLSGRKAWCSGAGLYTHALITAHAPGGNRMFAVDLRQPVVTSVDGGWATPALAGSDTRSVELSDAVATAVGDVDGYLERPGFWHGAVGVAAVWFGGAVGVARALATSAERRAPGEIGLMHLGAVDVALGAARAALQSAAVGFDADPRDSSGRAAVVARRTRGVVEATVADVVGRVGRSLGPQPLAGDEPHARRVADLQLYVRQSHAERDLADLGGRLLTSGFDW
jgi:hypothetical protein